MDGERKFLLNAHERLYEKYNSTLWSFKRTSEPLSAAGFVGIAMSLTWRKQFPKIAKSIAVTAVVSKLTVLALIDHYDSKAGDHFEAKWQLMNSKDPLDSIKERIPKITWSEYKWLKINK